MRFPETSGAQGACLLCPVAFAKTCISITGNGAFGPEGGGPVWDLTSGQMDTCRYVLNDVAKDNPVRRHGFTADLLPLEFERRYAQTGS